MDYESVTKRSVNSLVSFDSDSSNYQNDSNKIVFKGLQQVTKTTEEASQPNSYRQKVSQRDKKVADLTKPLVAEKKHLKGGKINEHLEVIPSSDSDSEWEIYQSFGRNFIEKNMEVGEFKAEIQMAKLANYCTQKEAVAIKNASNRLKLQNETLVYNMLYTVKNEYLQIKRRLKEDQEVKTQLAMAVKIAWVMNLFFIKVQKSMKDKLVSERLLFFRFKIRQKIICKIQYEVRNWLRGKDEIQLEQIQKVGGTVDKVKKGMQDILKLNIFNKKGVEKDSVQDKDQKIINVKTRLNKHGKTEEELALVYYNRMLVKARNRWVEKNDLSIVRKSLLLKIQTYNLEKIRYRAYRIAQTFFTVSTRAATLNCKLSNLTRLGKYLLAFFLQKLRNNCES